MHNERTNDRTTESEALTYEDYLINLLPLFNTALFTGINTAGASIGYALINQLQLRLAPASQQEVIKNAAISATLSFMVLSLGCAFFSKPSKKQNPRDRLSETASIFYPLACADMALAFPLPIFTAYFFYNLALYDATTIGICSGIGANLLLIPTLIAAMLFQAGNWMKPTQTAPDDQAFENRVRDIVRHTLSNFPAHAQRENDPIQITVASQAPNPITTMRL